MKTSKFFTAIYRVSRKGTLKDITREYSSKKQLTEDLRGNGFRVLAVLTQQEIKAYTEMSETEAILKGGNAELVREYCIQVLY